MAKFDVLATVKVHFVAYWVMRICSPVKMATCFKIYFLLSRVQIMFFFKMEAVSSFETAETTDDTTRPTRY
jgi:hypothetical protein